MSNHPPTAVAGFTLLEVIIAMAIMTIAFTSILAVEAGSINASLRTRQMNVVAMLARNKMIETEFKIEGKPFNEIRKEETGAYEAPFQDYRWKVEVKEVEFPKINIAGGGEEGDKKPGAGTTDIADQITKLLTKYLSKAIREVDVSILWQKSGKDQSFTVSTYWVDLNSEFQVTE